MLLIFVVLVVYNLLLEDTSTLFTDHVTLVSLHDAELIKMQNESAGVDLNSCHNAVLV